MKHSLPLYTLQCFLKKEGDTPMPHQLTELDLVKVEPGVTVISTDDIDSPVFFRTKLIATQPGKEYEIFGLEESNLSVQKRPLEQQFIYWIMCHICSVVSLMLLIAGTVMI